MEKSQFYLTLAVFGFILQLVAIDWRELYVTNPSSVWISPLVTVVRLRGVGVCLIWESISRGSVCPRRLGNPELFGTSVGRPSAGTTFPHQDV